MENIIGRLLEIDAAACKLVDDASNLRERAAAEFAAAKSDVYEHAKADTEAKLAAQRTEADAEIAAAKAEIAAAAAQNRAELERTFTENCEHWVDTIVTRCTSL